MDADEILAGLTPANRATPLERLLGETEDDDDERPGATPRGPGERWARLPVDTDGSALTDPSRSPPTAQSTPPRRHVRIRSAGTDCG
jgi:hypothetical protein